MAVSIIICCLVLLTLGNYMRFGDVLYPSFIQSALWTVVVTVFAINQEHFVTVSTASYLLVFFGCVAFSFGGALATRQLTNTKTTVVANFQEPSWRYWVLFGIALLCLPVFLYKAYKFGTSGPTSNFYINLRTALTGPLSTGGYGAVGYAIPISSLLVGITLVYYYLGKVKSSTMALALVIGLSYAIGATGRTFFLMLLCVVFGVTAVMKRPKLVYLAGVGGLVFALIFMVIGLSLGKIQKGDGSFLAGMGFFWNAMRSYLLSPFAAFDIYSQNLTQPEYGRNMFRTFLRVVDALGIETETPALIKEYVNVPKPTNVYTVYRPYFTDFGYGGAVLVQCLIGYWHGVIYRNTVLGSIPFVVLYGVFTYALLLQFFQDQYFNIFSQWIQYGVWILFVFGSSKVLSDFLGGRVTAKPA